MDQGKEEPNVSHLIFRNVLTALHGHRPIAFLYEMITVRRLYERVTTGKV
jgi:hypothetical protein